jgi:hypothetical protein
VNLWVAGKEAFRLRPWLHDLHDNKPFGKTCLDIVIAIHEFSDQRAKATPLSTELKNDSLDSGMS